MKPTIFIALIILSFNLNGQGFEGYEFIYTELAQASWQDDCVDSDTSFWKNGKPEFVITKENGKNFHYQYDKLGRQTMKYEIKCGISVDTVMTEDVDTGEINILVTNGYRSVPNGMYEYRFGFNSEDESKGYDVITGQYEIGAAIGIWTLYKFDEKVLVTAVLNERGLPDHYEEIYTETGNKKWIGQYGEIENVSIVEDLGIGKSHETIEVSTIKIGIWKKFNKEGQLIEEIDFDK